MTLSLVHLDKSRGLPLKGKRRQPHLSFLEVLMIIDGTQIYTEGIAEALILTVVFIDDRTTVKQKYHDHVYKH